MRRLGIRRGWSRGNLAATLALLSAIAAGCSGGDNERSAATTTTTSTSLPTDPDHVIPPCDFAAGDLVEAADAGRECVGLYDCPDGRVLAVAFASDPHDRLAGYLPDRGEPSEDEVVWHAYDHEQLPRQSNPDTGREELIGECPALA